METTPLQSVPDPSATRPTAAEKARARARLARVFEQVDRFGQKHAVDPDAADAAIDAAVREVRAAKSDDLPA